MDYRIAVVLAGVLGCEAEPEDGPGGATEAVGTSPSSGSATTSTPTAMATSDDPPQDDDNGTDDDPDPSDATPPGTGPGETGSGGSSGEETTGPAPVGCYDYDAFEASTVSYRADVMPIFAASCSACHADPDESVYFGMGGTSEAEAVAIYDTLLDGVPKQAPHLSFVVPGDPLRSYMLAKVEYDVPGDTCSEIQCDEPGCELQAPPAGQLPEPQLAILRSWVMGGALDD